MLVCVFCGCLCGDDLCAIGCLWFDFIWVWCAVYFVLDSTCWSRRDWWHCGVLVLFKVWCWMLVLLFDDVRLCYRLVVVVVGIRLLLFGGFVMVL